MEKINNSTANENRPIRKVFSKLDLAVTEAERWFVIMNTKQIIYIKEHVYGGLEKCKEYALHIADQISFPDSHAIIAKVPNETNIIKLLNN